MIKVKARPTVADLPAGYQFGDRGITYVHPNFRVRVTDDGIVRGSEEARIGTSWYPVDWSAWQALRADQRCGWRPMHENAADRLKRYQTEYEVGRDCGDEASA